LAGLDNEASARFFGNLTGLQRGRDLKLLEGCRYSGVVLGDALATPHDIRRLGASRSIAVRLPVREARRARGLVLMMRVDAIVTGDATEVVRVLQSR
jgi:hypothetical protein